jgi:hypothetical protein
MGGGKAAGSLDDKGQDRVDPVVIEKCSTIRLIGDENKLHCPLTRVEGGRYVIGLSMCQ